MFDKTTLAFFLPHSILIEGTAVQGFALGQLTLTSGPGLQQCLTIPTVLKTTHWPWVHTYGRVEVFASDIMYTADNTID